MIIIDPIMDSMDGALCIKKVTCIIQIRSLMTDKKYQKCIIVAHSSEDN